MSPTPAASVEELSEDEQLHPSQHRLAVNPDSKVYGLREVRRDFPSFQLTRAYKRWMHGPQLPVSWLPLGRLLGSHLWVHLRPIKPAR